MTRWHTEVTEDPAALTDLSDWWNVQPAAREIPFLNTAILQCWMSELMEQDQHPDIQILYKNGAPVAAAPMLRSRGRKRSMADQFDPFDLIVTEDSETTEHIPAWLNTWTVAHFYKVRQSSALVQQISSQSRWVVTKSRPSPYVDLTQGIDFARAGTSKEHRRAIRRRTRRLEEIGQLTFVDHPPVRDVAAVLDRGLELEAKGWKGERGGAVLCRPELERLYRAMAVVSDQNGWLRLSTLNLDERMVAFAYDIVYGARRYGMLSAYDETPEMSRLSVGSILVDRMLEQSAKDGLRSYEFGHGSSGWKGNWTDAEHIVYDISIYGSGLLGRASFGLRSMRLRAAQATSAS